MLMAIEALKFDNKMARCEAWFHEKVWHCEHDSGQGPVYSLDQKSNLQSNLNED